MKTKFMIIILLTAFVLNSCTSSVQPTASLLPPTVDNSMEVTSMPTPFVEASACTENMVLPSITDVQPSPALPGREITITARGGYVQDSCGGINASARSFKLYLDNEPVGDLSCYANHCETKINLSGSIEPKLHCLSTQPGVCEFQFQVDSTGILETSTSASENLSHCDWETQIIGTWHGKLDQDTLLTLKFSDDGTVELEDLYVPRQDRHYSSGTYKCLENGNISYSFSAFGGYNDIKENESEIQLSGNELTINFMDKKINLERSK